MMYGLLILIFLLFILQKWQNRSSSLTKNKAIKLYRYFRLIFIVVPVIVGVIFAILFATVLTGHFNERCSHALIILMLWLYATSFYADIVLFWKSKLNRIFCITGMVAAVGIAIYLTPLDRYIAILNDFVPVGTYILGILMLFGFYFSNLLFPLPRE